MSAYTLELTESEGETIAFVGYRYFWSEALDSLGTGRIELEEHEAWEIRDAFEADTEGGHGYFPMLDQSSQLAAKLYALMDEII